MGSDADKPLTAADLDALERLEREAQQSIFEVILTTYEEEVLHLAPRLLAAAREAARLRAEVAMHKTNCAALWARLPHPFALTPAGPLCDFCGLSADAHAAAQANQADAAAQKDMKAQLLAEVKAAWTSARPDGAVSERARLIYEGAVRLFASPEWKAPSEVRTAEDVERLAAVKANALLRAAEAEADAASWKVRAERAMRPFPILGDKTRATIPWCVAEVAYEDYKRRFGDGQTLERIAERGGFCPLELIEHLGLKAAAERAAKEGGK